MNVKDFTQNILMDIGSILEQISAEKADLFIEKMLSSKRIFVAGVGRSRLMMNAFAMRLMHLGMSVYVVGETVTPAITDEDLLIIGSGSGETATLKVIAQKAKRAHAAIAAITTNVNSTISSSADVIVEIPASINHIKSNGNSWQPGGNSFEQSLLIFLDAAILMLAERKKIDISSSLTLHANLE